MQYLDKYDERALSIKERIIELNNGIDQLQETKVKMHKATEELKASYLIELVKDSKPMVDTLRKGAKSLDIFKSDLSQEQLSFLRSFNYKLNNISKFISSKVRSLTLPKWINIINNEQMLNNSVQNSYTGEQSITVKMESSVEMVYLSSDDETQTTITEKNNSYEHLNSTSNSIQEKEIDTSMGVSKMKIKKVGSNYEISKPLSKDDEDFNNSQIVKSDMSAPSSQQNSTIYRTNSTMSSLDSINSIIKLVNDSLTEKSYTNKLPIANADNFQISTGACNVSSVIEVITDLHRSTPQSPIIPQFDQSETFSNTPTDDISSNQLGNKTLDILADDTNRDFRSRTSSLSEQINVNDTDDDPSNLMKIPELKNDIQDKLVINAKDKPIHSRSKSNIKITKIPKKNENANKLDKILADRKLNLRPIVRLVQLPVELIKKHSKKSSSQNSRSSYKSFDLNDTILNSGGSSSEHSPNSRFKNRSPSKSDCKKKSFKLNGKNSFLFKRSNVIDSNDSSCDSMYENEKSFDSHKKSSSKPKKKSDNLLKHIQTKHIDETKLPENIKKSKDTLTKNKKIKQNLKNHLFQSKIKSIQNSKSSAQAVFKRKTPTIESPQQSNVLNSAFRIPKTSLTSNKPEIKKSNNEHQESAKSRINQALKKNKNKIKSTTSIQTNNQIDKPSNVNKPDTVIQSDILTVSNYSNKLTDFPTISQINETKKNFNQSIGCMHPYFSLSFLLKDYLATIVKVPSLDINLLSKNIISRTSDPLCVSNLSSVERSELCRLMSRNAGKINFYQLFGIGHNLRENLPKNSFNISNFDKYAYNLKHGLTLEFENEREEQIFVSEAISKLSMAEVYVLYCHYKQRLNSPYRNIKYFFDQKINTYNMRIRFENNWPTKEKDPSPEECVKYVLHVKKDDTSIKESLFRNYETKTVEPTLQYNLKVSGINFAKEKLRDEYEFDRLFMKKTYDRIGLMPEFSMRECFNNPKGYFKCDNIDIENYKTRKDDNSYSTRQCGDERPRFLNYSCVSNKYSNMDRGRMRKAESFESMSETEYKYKMKQLNANSEFDVNISQFLDSL